MATHSPKLVAAVILGLALFASGLSCPASASAQGDPSGRSARAARLRSMGQAYVAAGDPGSAMAYFRDAIAADPRDAESHVLLGRIYLDRQRLEDGLHVLSAGLAVRPDYGPLWRALAEGYQAQGDLGRAGAALRELTLRLPGDWEGHLARAELSRRRRAHAEALGSYRALVALAAEGAPVPSAAVAEARRYAAALEVLLREVDPVTGPDRCRDASPVRRALAGC